MTHFFSVARPQGLHRPGAASGSRLLWFRPKLSWLSSVLLSALAPAFLVAPPAHAVDFTLYEYVGSNQGSWFTPANWERGEISVEGEYSKTLVARGLTARIEAPGAVAGIMFLGNTETGTLAVGANGTLTMDLLLAGYQSSGYLNVSSGGHVTVAQETIIGHMGDGFVSVTGAGSIYTHQFYALGKAVVGSSNNGTLTISNQGLAEFHAVPLYLGGVGGATGTVTVTSGGVLAADAIEERNSAGSLILDGGILRALSDNRPLLNKFAAGHVSLGPAGGTIDTQSYRVSALSVIGGAGALIKTGTGRLVLSAANTYSGGTVLREGTIEVSSDSYLGAAAGRLTFEGGELALGDGLTINRPITVSSGGGTIAINGTGFNGASATLAGDLSGSGTLVREGTGDLYLTGNNVAFSGSFRTTTAGGLGGFGGALVPRNNAALGTATVILDHGRLALPGGVTVGNTVSLAAAGQILNFGAGTAAYNGAVVLNSQTLTLTSLGAGGGSLTFGGSTTGIGDLSLGTAGGTLLITGNLNHVGKIEHLGSGGSGGSVKITGTIGAGVSGVRHDSQNASLILTGNNLYPGTTTNTQGTLQIGDGGTTGNLSGDIVNHGDLIFHRSDSFTYAKNIGGSGSLEKLGAGTLTLSGLVSHTGTTTISAGTLQIGAGGAIANLTGDIVNHGTLVLHHSGVFKYDHAISGSGNLIKVGSGETILTGDNTFTGGTTVLGGVLSVGEGTDGGALMAGVSAPAVTLLGGNLNLRAGSIRGGHGVDVINGTGSAGGVGVVLDAPGLITNAGTMSGGNGGHGIWQTSMATGGIGGAGVSLKTATSFTNQGTVAGGAGGNANHGLGHGAAGGAGITFAGSGLLTNQGTITGGQGGVGSLSFGAGGVGVIVTGGGAVVTQPGSMIQGGLSGSGGRAPGLQFTAASTLVHQGAIVGGVSMDNSAHSVKLFTGSSIAGGPLLIGSHPAATLTLDGTGTHSLTAAVPSGIVFAGLLSKQGSGIWTIDQNMATGTVSVIEGKLFVTASITGTLSTAPGTTLGGTGTIGGNASINGILAPGLNAGKVIFNGDLTLGSSSITILELGGTSTSLFDQVFVDDALTYGGRLSLSLINGFTPAIGDTFQVFQDFNSQTGSFAGIAFTNPGVVGNFNYATGQLSVVAVPEPSSGLLAGTALLGLLARRRRGQSVA